MLRIPKIISHFKENPKSLFHMDSIGAFITSFIIFVVLRNNVEYIGISQLTLTKLSVIAFFLGIYSLSCFLFLKINWVKYLWGISLANLFYCILTIRIVILNINSITPIGLAYFTIEVIIILLLVYFELKVALTINKF